MPNFVDKENLPQYKFFHNMLEEKTEYVNIIADFMAANYIFTCSKKNRDLKQYRKSLYLLGRVKKQLPEFLYIREEDQKRCGKDIATKNINLLQKKMERYIDILLALPFFQGDQMTCQIEVDNELLAKLTDGQKEKLYEYDQKSGKYFLKVLSIPKLLLISREVYQQHLQRKLTEIDCEQLGSIMSEDVHYIVNIQEESESETAYMVIKDRQQVHIESMHREKGIEKKYLNSLFEITAEMTSVLLSLLDYLKEIEKIERDRRKYAEKGIWGQGYLKKQRYVQKYVDKNSIKVFDIKNAGSVLESAYFSKKHKDGKSYQKIGYEVMPHARKGHYRRYKSGKTIYVRATFVHKENYRGVQLAHRLNKA